MRTRRLGTSDLELTTVGFGAWAIGGEWAYGWGPQDDQQSVRAIHQALDLGINWIDTAAVYGLGHSEEVVARALADRPSAGVMVATKCGLRWREDGSIFGALGAQSVREELEASLRRLRRDVIDLYQIHWPNPQGAIEEGWGAVAELVRQGKVRHAGVSNFNVAQLRRAGAIHPVTSLQPPYSMVNRGVEAKILPYCAEQRIGVVAYSPLQCGLLTGDFDRARLEGLPATDWRREDRFFREPIFSRILERVQRLRPLAAEAGRTLAELAVAWVLRRPEVTAAIVGARSPLQIAQTAAAADWELDAELQERVDAVLAPGAP